MIALGSNMRRLLRAILAAGALGLIAPIASASTIATFTWVDIAGTGSGTLVLTLPGSITSDTFSTGTLTASAAWADLTSFSYTFSDGLTVTLADLTSHTFSSPVSWATSNKTHAGFGSGTYDLITGFTFGGNQSIGTGGPSNYQIAEPAGLVGNVGQDANTITPSHGSASNDAGYWELKSLTAVPLPPGLPLLATGIAVFLALRWTSSKGARERLPAALLA